FQAEDGIRDLYVTGVQTCALPICWFEKTLGAEGKAALDARIAAATPMAMAPQAEDIAAPIEMLLDPATRAITGETWRVDAGTHRSEERRVGKECRSRGEPDR